MSPSLQSRTLGRLSTGEPVDAWTFRGAGGLALEVMTYGGIVTRLLAPDREGHPADVVLGLKYLEDYLAGHPHFGAITGRVAGRVKNGLFQLDGKTYQLPRNEGAHHLHGGPVGFDKKIWAAQPVEREDNAPSLRLTLRSHDGDQGYPGTVDVVITYTVTADNTFLIESEAVTDRPTPFNLTHHSYFNLAGEATGAEAIADHELSVHADVYIGLDADQVHLDRSRPVDGQANDLRQSRRLGSVIPCLFQNHGDLYLLGENGGPVLIPAARLAHPSSGRVLNVATTEPCLQLYTGSSLDGSIVGKSGVPYPRHAGICLECEGFPGAILPSALGDIILRPGQVQRRTTAYAFSTMPAAENPSTP